MDVIDSVKSKAGDFYKQWVRLSSTEGKAPQKLTIIEELPFYPEPRKRFEGYTFVEESPYPLQKEFATIRYAARDQYSLISERFETVDKFGKCCKKHYSNTKAYLSQEGTIIPKAAAISLGGIAGFILGVKRYGIRRFVYAGGAIATMTAFCYPDESVQVVKTGYYHGQSALERMRSSK
uniref:MICOS complex subunit n=1 Tax=Rhabditophanes sp. KR3021 TaxID=114890 RepID=A0AC35U3P5_9BILA